VGRDNKGEHNRGGWYAVRCTQSFGNVIVASLTRIHAKFHDIV
jgi:hypothetical protein